MTKHMRYARMIVFLIAGAVLTYYLLSLSGSVRSTVSNIFSALRKADLRWVGVSLTLFAVTQLIRAWRWQALSWGHRIELKQSLPLTSVHVGLGHLLPVRLSDVALVGLFRKYAALPVGNGAATVLLAKIMDVIAMGFIVACSFIAGLSGPVVYVAATASLAGILSLFFLPFILSILAKPVKALFGERKLTACLTEMIEATEITKERKRKVSIAMGLSIAGWAVKLFMFFALLRSVGVTGLPMWQIFTASAIADLTMALPVHGLLSLGTVEAGWVAGFALTGISGMLPGGLTVIEAGFGVHLLWLSMAVLLMLGGVAALLISGRKGAI
ncbi:MAG: flippase-like domain-containing protein [Candidatus Sabulitectum sp.]|nr:flippase-like domain-containing protein [Candidatus Sabulitectum sp.]